MMTNRREIHIEWGDCDPAGVVYFPRYFEYFDSSTNRLFECAGLHKAEMMKTYGIVGIPLVDARAQFLLSSTFGETVVVETCIKEWGRTSFTIQHRLYKGDVLAVEAFEKRVWAVRSEDSSKRIKSHPIPQEVKDRFMAEAPKQQSR
jgi:4-hydroxybenzoyl-CoA thioesterase